MEYRVSIIMGIYNCESTLEEAINSILNQTFTAWKVIMCDDGSSDNTYMVAKKYADVNPQKFVLIKNDINMGLNYTLNHCLKYADTEYVARMDGDDISMPSRLQREVDFLDSHPEYDIVSTPMIYFDEQGVYRIGKGYGEPQITEYAKGTPFNHAPCMVRKRAYSNVNGYAEKKNKLRVEDWDLWIRMREKGHRGYMLQEALYKMRDDRGAYSRRKFKFRFNEALVIASAVKKLDLPKIYYIRTIRPILVGLLPRKLYQFLHRSKLKDR